MTLTWVRSRSSIGMEFIAFDVEGCISSSETLMPLDRRWIELAANFEAGFGRCVGNQLDHGEASVSGVPRQFWVMWQNMRCSILSTSRFRAIMADLDGETGVIASCWSASFHSRSVSRWSRRHRP